MHAVQPYMKKIGVGDVPEDLIFCHFFSLEKRSKKKSYKFADKREAQGVF